MFSAFSRAQRRAKYNRLRVPGSLQSSRHKVPSTKLRNHSGPPLESSPGPTSIPVAFQKSGHM